MIPADVVLPCQQGDPTRWDYDAHPRLMLEAALLCGGCPFKAECVVQARSEPGSVWGIRGGLLFPYGRRILLETDKPRPGRPRGARLPLRPCGTRAAFVRHKKRGQRPCLACRVAAREYQNSRDRVRTS